ncbi:MAG: copper chaperone [Calditrichaeota bacterium]|nr:heavy-metal-associated domain-containing protein [Calditrichota bacterium]RQV92567.1 MAG: copper chaperone [bacterium]RQV99641.1 MAG: copper chaperone [Calditrichota bacterium]
MKVKIKVPDMHCDHCKMTLEQSVGSLEGVSSVTVDLDARVVEADGEFELDDVVSAITNSGYSAREILDIQ